MNELMYALAHLKSKTDIIISGVILILFYTQMLLPREVASRTICGTDTEMLFPRLVDFSILNFSSFPNYLNEHVFFCNQEKNNFKKYP